MTSYWITQNSRIVLLCYLRDVTKETDLDLMLNLAATKKESQPTQRSLLVPAVLRLLLWELGDGHFKRIPRLTAQS